MLYLSSTSNHNLFLKRIYYALVVLYLSSTSNHNRFVVFLQCLHVVLYLSSTSNHNQLRALFRNCGLCYIFLLHQTTTFCRWFRTACWLCYIFLLHQTTTEAGGNFRFEGCVISFFYIKPQLLEMVEATVAVVLYLSSTSNHNCTTEDNITYRLCYIFLLHQTTTVRGGANRGKSCVISFFYIKPQLFTSSRTLILVVLYLSSTSNHNR